MTKLDVNVVIGGPQGGGIDTSANLMSRAFAFSGFDIFSTREFHSNIKGRHSYVHIRARDTKVQGLKYPPDILVALDPDTIFEHFEDIGKGTKVIYDSSFATSELSQARMIMRDTASRIKSVLDENKLENNVKGMLEYMKSHGGILFPIPFEEIVRKAVDDGVPNRYYNTLGAAITLSIIGIESESTKEAIKHIFGGKEKVIAPNLKVVDEAYRYAQDNKLAGESAGKNAKLSQFLLTGNDGAAIGKLMGGLRFQTYYPITPASDESSILEEHEAVKWLSGEAETLGSGGVTVVQTEDEISAVVMAAGAAMTGTRSATATSGPGFSLMAEGISFAGMDEIPLVITLYQRGGPSTGLPTRNGQSDLLFALNTGHGEFPRIVLSSGDVGECIYDSMKALNYAQRYQLPVLHLIDKNLANTTELVDGIDIKKEKVYGRNEPDGNGTYKRYSLDTKDGVSAIGAFGKNIFWLTGDEHDELGHVTEDTVMREAQMEKRFRKVKVAAAEIPVEEKAVIYGDKNAKITIVTWGSQKGPSIEAAEILSKQGIKCRVLYLRMFMPFPSEFVEKELRSGQTNIIVESNMLGQAAQVIRMNTGVDISNRILKYNGRHVTVDELVDGVKRIVQGKEKEVVLKNGA